MTTEQAEIIIARSSGEIREVFDMLLNVLEDKNKQIFDLENGSSKVIAVELGKDSLAKIEPIARASRLSGNIGIGPK